MGYGKSLSENVLFTVNDAWKLIFICLFVVLGLIFLFTWRKIGFSAFLQKTECWIPLLLGTTLISFILLVQFMQVNYPMDRVGMYLVPLFILTFGLLLQKFLFTKWSLFLLLLFPISFVFKMNLNTSIFSPEDRIHQTFYQKIQNLVQANDVISADYVSQASYAYLSRSEKIPHVATDYLPNDTLSRGDFHISWVEKLNWPNYSCILFDPISGTRLYKRKAIFEKRLVLDTVIQILKSKKRIIPIMQFNLSSFANKLLQTSIEGCVELDKYCLDLNLRHDIQPQKGKVRRTDNTRFNWYFGRKTNYRFQYPTHLIYILPEDHYLYIRFYNDDLNEVNLPMIRVKIYALTKKFK